MSSDNQVVHFTKHQIFPTKIFPPKNFIGKICLSPFVQIHISLDGTVRICGCENWMSADIGNIFNSKLTDLLNSLAAKNIRQSIIDGSYIYCNENTCGIIRNNLLNSTDTLPPEVTWQTQDASRFCMPREISIAGDRTCNLSCPSCRTGIIKPTEEEKQQQEKLVEVFRNNIFSQPTDQPINLILSVSGELFASSFLLSFVRNISLTDFPNTTLTVQTNGLLCEQNWHKLGNFQNRVKKITVTIDAAQADTYEKLRRGGSWDQIISSMTWLQQKKQQNSMKLSTRMVVQKDNYKQVEDFYKLSKTFDVDQIEYARISHWGTMSNEEFNDIDVLNPTHQLYDDAIKFWKPIENYPDVLSWG